MVFRSDYAFVHSFGLCMPDRHQHMRTMDGRSDQPWFWQRNWRIAMQRSKLCRFFFMLTLTGLLIWVLVRSTTIVRSQSSIRRKYSAQFSGDAFLKYQAGIEQEYPKHGTMLRYIKGRIAGHSRKPYNLTTSKLQDFSRAGESRFVDNIFNRMENGFFVDCGAGDGEKFSNTLFLERQRGWNGLLIEANPWSYRNLLYKRRKTFSINSCINPELEAKVMAFRAAGLRGSVEGIGDSYQSLKDHPDYSGQDAHVQCFPFMGIMQSLGVQQIDYLSVNLHGHELEILKSIPFDDLDIRLVSVEYQKYKSSAHLKTDTDATLNYLKDIKNFFNSTGLYEFIGVIPKSKDPSKTWADGQDAFFKKFDQTK